MFRQILRKHNTIIMLNGFKFIVATNHHFFSSDELVATFFYSFLKSIILENKEILC